MKAFSVFVFLSVFIHVSAPAQLVQTGRYELEKENYDDYFTVVSAEDQGLIIFRDTDEYRRNEGDIWQIIALDTMLQEKWLHELAINERYIFKGYEVKNSKLFLLFRTDESSTSSYHLITIELEGGAIDKYTIKNEIDLQLSHLIVVDHYLILGGYVRHSPTFVSYDLWADKVKVIPGFFKSRSDIVDLKNNDNGTFNILTLEKNNDGYQLKLRTCAPKGGMLFEKPIVMDEEYRVLSGKSSGFVDGNIVISGTYGNPTSYYAQGIYFAIVKPKGQKDIIKYYNFAQLEHFFDYMGPRRAARIRRRIDRKISKGKEFKYSSRLLLHEVRKQDDGYLLAAEIYNPQFERIGGSGMYSPYGYGFGADNDFGRYATAHQKYVKRPGRLSHVDNANHFEYLQSVILKLDNKGALAWDNSFTVENVENYSLEKVVDFHTTNDRINLLYNTDETLNYKVINQSETLAKAQEKLLLQHENDAIKHTYEGIGGSRHWYADFFYVWGYHRVGNNENSNVPNKRSVLFINKVMFEK